MGWFSRRRHSEARPRSVASKLSAMEAEAVVMKDEAASSVNLDHEDINIDGANLVAEARQIVERSENEQTNNSDYDHFQLKMAQNILANEPRRRLRFADSTEDSKDGEPDIKMVTFEQGLTSGIRNGFSDGFFDETVDSMPARLVRQRRSAFKSSRVMNDSASVAGCSSGGTSNGRPNTEHDDESVLTMNLDADEHNEQEPNMLARGIGPQDFKWLCISGGIPLTFLCGASNGISFCGPLGILLGYLCVLPGLWTIMSCICEMIAFHPMDGGFTLLICEYIEPSLGLSIGVLYWLNCALTVPMELLECAKLLTVFPILDSEDSSRIVFLTFFLVVLFVCSCQSIRAQTPLLRYASMVTFCFLLVICFVIWIVCIPHMPPGRSLALWRQSSGFRSEDKVNGIGVNRWLQFFHGCSLALRSYTGIDVVYTAMPEIRNARRTIKTSFYWINFRMTFMYLVVIISFTFVTNPEMYDLLYRSAWDSSSKICDSMPNMISGLMRTDLLCSVLPTLAAISQCTLYYMLNAFIIYCGLFDAGVRLYGASRTLHGLGISGVLWKQLAWCTRERVPIVAVIITILVSPISYIAISENIGVVSTLLQVYLTHATLTVWSTFCFAFIRFYKAMKVQESRTHVSRNSDDYPFKSWFQPYAAMLAIAWCIILFTSTLVEQCFYNNFFGSRFWKGNLAAGFLPLLVGMVIYSLSKRHMKSKIVPLERIGILAAKRRMDAEEWEEDRVYIDPLKVRIGKWLP